MFFSIVLLCGFFAHLFYNVFEFCFFYAFGIGCHFLGVGDVLCHGAVFEYFLDYAVDCCQEAFIAFLQGDG